MNSVIVKIIELIKVSSVCCLFLFGLTGCGSDVDANFINYLDSRYKSNDKEYLSQAVIQQLNIKSFAILSIHSDLLCTPCVENEINELKKIYKKYHNNVFIFTRGGVGERYSYFHKHSFVKETENMELSNFNNSSVFTFLIDKEGFIIARFISDPFDSNNEENRLNFYKFADLCLSYKGNKL